MNNSPKTGLLTSTTVSLGARFSPPLVLEEPYGRFGDAKTFLKRSWLKKLEHNNPISVPLKRKSVKLENRLQ